MASERKFSLKITLNNNNVEMGPRDDKDERKNAPKGLLMNVESLSVWGKLDNNGEKQVVMIREV